MRAQSFLRPSSAVCLVSLAGLVAAGCRDQADEPTTTGDVEIAGHYEVQGTTADLESGQKRRIAGTIVIEQDGDHYTATYELRTTFPTEDGSADADVLGFGEGTISGGELVGTARTQLVISAVPGVDPGFAFVPRTVTTVVVSDSTATIDDTGNVSIALENRAAEGEAYRPTRTRLTGRRVADSPKPVARDAAP